MKNQKGFIQIPILIAIIIAGVLVLGGAGYFGVKQYRNYQAEKIKKEKIALEAQQQKDSEVEKLRQEVETLKNKKPEIIQQTIIKEVPLVPKTNNDLPSIIQQWQPRIVYIECEFRFTTGQQYLTQTGSGFLLAVDDNTFVLTNAHVVFEEASDGRFAPYACNFKLADDPSVATVVFKDRATGSIGKDDAFDFSVITIKTPTQYMLQTTKEWLPVCQEIPRIGDKVVIMGYPGIGSRSSITATEGIVSGYDGDYFVTSAKVDHGNSGGVAVLTDKNCYLGIPTYVRAGEFETLARVLSLKRVFPPDILTTMGGIDN